MGSRESNETQRIDREIERYREAAASALQQIEWSVGYLRQIRKPELAQALDRNRRQILERMG